MGERANGPLGLLPAFIRAFSELVSRGSQCRLLQGYAEHDLFVPGTTRARGDKNAMELRYRKATPGRIPPRLSPYPIDEIDGISTLSHANPYQIPSQPSALLVGRALLCPFVWSRLGLKTRSRLPVLRCTIVTMGPSFPISILPLGKSLGAQDPNELARVANGESFEDATVSDPFQRQESRSPRTACSQVPLKLNV